MAVVGAGVAQQHAEKQEYQYLIARPHPWRRQLSLRGRNMTVGQLVASMRANRLDAAAASVELDLPIEKIEEALSYYAANRGLVDRELREDRIRLEAKGYPIEPPPLS